MIDVEDLVFDYPDLRALDGVGFSLREGSITALVGPNGAGKSTLLRCLAALARPFAGTVRVAGHDTVEAPREVHRSLGYLSDFFGLYDELTVRRSLTFMASARGVSTDRVEPTAEALDLAAYLDAKASTLSRGLRQRLAIAMAIIHRPKVLLLDEPASGLDPEARYALGDLFKSLRDQGMTLLVSSHILAELEQYATDVLMLRDGKVLEHHPLGTGGPGGKGVMLRLELAAEAPALAARLAADGEVIDPVVEGLAARFHFSGDADGRRRLLAALVAEGVPVCGLAPASGGIQEAYLERVARAEGGHD